LTDFKWNQALRLRPFCQHLHPKLRSILPYGSLISIGASRGTGHLVGVFIMCQVLRWTYLGAAEFIKAIWEAIRGVKEKPPTLDHTPRSL
jgi:hypothetical protein